MKLPTLKLPILAGIILWVLVFGTYIYSACRTNPGYADSDELITVGYLLGSAHPSGYPLFATLLKLAMLVPIPGTMAFKANLFCGLLHSLTVVAVYFISLELFRLLPFGSNQKKETDAREEKSYEYLKVSAAFFGSLMLAFSALFWLYSGVTEVGSLNDLLAALSILLGLLWRREVSASIHVTGKEVKLFLATSFVAGIGLSHVHTFIMMMPGLGVLFIQTIIQYKRWQLYGWKYMFLLIGVTGAGFILPNLLLFWLNSKQNNVSWQFEQSLEGWYNHIRRRVYSGYIPEKDINVTSYIVQNFNLGKYLSVLPGYWKFVSEHFSYIGTALGFGGLSWLVWKNRTTGLILLPLILIPGMFFGMYMGIPELSSQSLEYHSILGVSHRQYLIGETVWGIAVVLGVGFAMQLCIKAMKKINTEVVAMLSMGAALIVLWFVWDNHTMGIQRNNTIAWDYARNVLESAPQNASVICFADFSCFSLMYMQEVEGLRPDVVLLSKNLYIKRYYLNRHPELTLLRDRDNPYFSADLITWNVANNRPTYITDAVGYYVRYVGLEGNPFYLIPEKYMFKVVTRVPDQVSEWEYPVTEKLLQMTISPKNHWMLGQREYFANFHNINALIYSYLNLKDEARKQFKLTLQLKPDYTTAANLLSSLAAYPGNPNYSLGKESSPAAFFFEKAVKEIGTNQLNEGYQSLQKATFLDPFNKEYRQRMAELYIQGGYLREAAMEYDNLRRLFPDDEEMKKRFEELQTKIDQSTF